MPPPIRYPLPTLIAVLLLALLAWRGAGWARNVRDALAARWQRAVAGPPVPVSNTPRSIAGPLVRRALLLRDDTPVAPRPDARPDDAIARRMFVDVYDSWPMEGIPTHLRVGNRRPIGWVAAGEVLPWDTRLVVLADRLMLADRPDGPAESTEVGRAPIPVVAWQGDRIEVILWKPDAPWSAVARRGWTKLADLPTGALGVLLAREEIPALLSQSLAADTVPARDRLRLGAILGRVSDAPDWPESAIDQARSALPPTLFARPAGLAPAPADRLASANADPRTDASWSGHAFRFVTLDDLP
jgi:hypothetical protein